MARQQPSQNTYQTKTIRLVKELNSRGIDTSKDIEYFNVYTEAIKNKNTKEDETLLVKRDGSTPFINSVAVENVRGMYYWLELDRLIVAVNNDIYTYRASTGILLGSNLNVLTTTTGAVGFTEFLYDDGNFKVVGTDGTTLFTIDSVNTYAASVSADLPVPHLPYPVFLDGFLFILKANAADLYNSNLNNPLLWTAGDFITAEMLPDRTNWLSRLNNYLIITGRQSIEYFWNAAIATGSPLQRNDTPIKLSGLIGGQASLGNRLFIVGQQDISLPDVFVLEDFKMIPIGNEAIRRHLSSLNIDTAEDIKGSIVSFNGHYFYVLNTGTRCYVYDVESKLWCRWGHGSTETFNFTHWLNVFSPTGYTTLFALSGNSTIYKTSPSLYQDNGETFPVVVVLDNEEFGTYNQKNIHRLTVWADRPTASAPLTLQWSDDDYNSFNTGVVINLFSELPCARRLGRFRRRVFKITFTENLPLRLKSLEVDINMGQH